jgi:hypothetical protein
MRMENDEVAAIEVWLDYPEMYPDPKSPLILFDVFDSVDEAKAALRAKYATDEDPTD